MKKALITILTVLTALLVFVSCTNSVDDYFDPPQPTPTPTPEEKVWQVQDDKFATLQEAIDSCKAAKSSGIEITLLKDAKGPGAEISGEDEAYVINFAGHSFAFTGDYGIKVSDKAFVRLASSSDAEITLDNETENLALIKIEGDGAKAEIEGSANLSVADNQYVIYAKDGADVKAGNSDESLVKLSGRIASRNDNNGPKTVVSLLKKTSAYVSEVVFYGEEADKAEVVLGTEYQNDGHTGRVVIIDISGYEFGNTIFNVTSTLVGTIILDESSHYPESLSEHGGVVITGYIIVYVTNGGTLTGEKPYYKSTDHTTLPTADPASTTGVIARDGYVFKGWYTKPDFSGASYTTTGGLTGDLTFYAKWNPAVTLNANGGTVNDPVSEYVEGTATALPTDVTRAGYEFKGWFDNEQCLGDAIASISADARGPKTYYAKWALNVNYVGKVVKRSTDGSEDAVTYITPVFYSQPVTVVDYDVSYNFFYSNDNGITIVQLGDTVAANAIVAGNGNTGTHPIDEFDNTDSTAYRLNKYLQASIDEGHATENSVIYYEIINPSAKYVENNDAYAAFYMYLPADGGVNVYYEGETAKSAGSSFSKQTGFANIQRELTQPVLKTNDPTINQPKDWVRLTWGNEAVVRNPATNRVDSTGDIDYTGEGKLFTTGRFNVNTLKSWIVEDPVKKSERLGYYYPESTTTAWEIVDLANKYSVKNPSIGIYHDWFLPSYGEVHQMRLSFGPQGTTTDEANTWYKTYYGRAVMGNDNYMIHSNYVITSSTSGDKSPYFTNDKLATMITFGSDTGLDWSVSHYTNAGSNWTTGAVVLVRTF